MKIIPIITFIIHSNIIFSQGEVFNKTYDNDSNYEGAFAILHNESLNQWIVGGTTSDLQGFSAVYVLKLNVHGDTVWTKILDLTTEFEACYGSCFSNTGNYILVGNTKDSLNLSTDIFVLEMDTAGNILWWNRYGGSGDESCQMIKLTADDGYILSGWTTTNTTGLEDAYIIKIDSIGNVLWEQQFGLNYSDLFYSVDFTADGGYIFGGATFSYGLHSRDLYLVKTNSIGQMQWYKTYGTPNEDFGQVVISTNDGGYAFCGNIETHFLIDKQGYFLKTDSLGTIQWDLVFGTDSVYEGFEAVSQLSDGNFILIGNSGRNNVEGVVVKVNSLGDTMWSKNYRHNPIDINNQHYFYGLCSSPNKNGICGMTIENTMPNKNNFWLVVIDSLGCDNTSCIINDITEENIYTTKMMVYPNPAKNVINLSMEELVNQEIMLEFYDIEGRRIKSFSFVPESRQKQIDISQFESGLYLLRLTNNSVSTTSKFIIK